jgi:hypothetical protein
MSKLQASKPVPTVWRPLPWRSLVHSLGRWVPFGGSYEHVAIAARKDGTNQSEDATVSAANARSAMIGLPALHGWLRQQARATDNGC